MQSGERVLALLPLWFPIALTVCSHPSSLCLLTDGRPTNKETCWAGLFVLPQTIFIARYSQPAHSATLGFLGQKQAQIPTPQSPSYSRRSRLPVPLNPFACLSLSPIPITKSEQQLSPCSPSAWVKSAFRRGVKTAPGGFSACRSHGFAALCVSATTGIVILPAATTTTTIRPLPTAATAATATANTASASGVGHVAGRLGHPDAHVGQYHLLVALVFPRQK